jgi:ABC-type glycerol-3-phosphate transport system permease component
VLPLSKPLIAVLFFMSLLQSWNDFAWPLISLKENRLFTLPIGCSTCRVSSAPTTAPRWRSPWSTWCVQGFSRSGLR